MYPPKSDAGAAFEMDSKPQPAAFPPPVTGVPVGQHPNHYANENPQYPPPPHHQLQPQPQPQQHHNHQQHTSWSSGLCDCCSDVPNCCLTCWCPCITFGRMAEITDKGLTSCAASGAIYCLLTWFTGCSCLYSCIYRSKLRKQYVLEERPCNDCLVHCCCESCALCQEYRELEHRGFDLSIGWEENMQRPNRPSPPVVEPGMTR